MLCYSKQGTAGLVVAVEEYDRRFFLRRENGQAIGAMEHWVWAGISAGVADGAADVGGATALGRARGGCGGSLQCAELLRQQLSLWLDGDVLRGKHPLL
jgi:hypothetical protein